MTTFLVDDALVSKRLISRYEPISKQSLLCPCLELLSI